MIDFVKNRKIYLAISAILLLVIIVSSVVLGARLDIQFKGGAILKYNYSGELDKGQFQTTIESVLGEKVTIQETKDAITGSNSYTVTLAAEKGIPSEKQMELSSAIESAYGGQVEQVSSSVVDPTIGKEFFAKSLIAVAVAAIIMIVYIAIRFKILSGWSAGVFAVVALLHDVIIIYGTFIICRMTINDNFIAVILTILGYSLNDTIVIYDRIRENKRRFGGEKPLDEIVNMSINQSLFRTICTTATTVAALAVIAIVALIFHVDSILSFAFPLIIGMISGVYSSVCLSGPLWVLWQDHKAKKIAKA